MLIRLAGFLVSDADMHAKERKNEDIDESNRIENSTK